MTQRLSRFRLLVCQILLNYKAELASGMLKQRQERAYVCTTSELSQNQRSVDPTVCSDCKPSTF